MSVQVLETLAFGNQEQRRALHAAAVEEHTVSFLADLNSVGGMHVELPEALLWEGVDPELILAELERQRTEKPNNEQGAVLQPILADSANETDITISIAGHAAAFAVKAVSEERTAIAAASMPHA